MRTSFIFKRESEQLSNMTVTPSNELLFRRVHLELESLSKQAHKVFRALASACDLFIKDDAKSLNALVAETRNLLDNGLPAARRRLVEEVAKAYAVLPLVEEFLRTGLVLSEAASRAEKVIYKISFIAGEKWLSDTATEDNLTALGAAVLEEFEKISQAVSVMSDNRESAIRIVEEAEGSAKKVADYARRIDRIILKALGKTPSLMIMHEIVFDFGYIAEKLLELAHSLRVIAAADSAFG